MIRRIAGMAAAFLLVMPVAGLCGGDLNVFLGNMNVQARADLPAFTARLSATFGVPAPQVEILMSKVREPADAYMVLKVGEVARQPETVVLHEYQANRGKGWGVIAKNLGIKPGSREFHELKRGLGGDGPGKGKSRAKGRGKGRR
ncbi:MAG: hypothetical protein ACM3NF_07410 [Gemmatimonadota bacterium]